MSSPIATGGAAAEIFDSHVQMSFRSAPLERLSPLRADDLTRLLDGPYPSMRGPVGIARALAIGDPADTALGADVSQSDARLVDLIGELPTRLVGCATVNPLQDLDATVARLRRLVLDEDFRAVKLHPTAHGYLPHRSADRLGPLLEEAAHLGTPVLVDVGDPPFGFPSLIGPIAETHPDVTFVLCSFGTGQVSYALEAVYVARMNPNVVLQTSNARLRELRQAVQALGTERLVFASDLPHASPASQIAVIEALSEPAPLGMGLDRASIERILGPNLDALLTG